MEIIPIVTLDKIYLEVDNKNIFFLDCTRLEGSNKLVSRNNINDLNNVNKQIEELAYYFKTNNTFEIVLADDVIFSGSVIKKIIEKFNKYNIKVLGVYGAISTINAYEYFNRQLEYGLNCNYLLLENVIDQICERDFYFGIAQSGISIIKNNNLYKAPYFKPFGTPIERASIPKEYEKYFSLGCINRSIELWKEIEKNSKREIYIKELPEKINLTNENSKVIKTLRKEIKKI